jgi:hypothetical protein
MGFDELEFRISFGPVGHRSTYAETATQEYRAALKALGIDSQSKLVDVSPSSGFRHGRALIEEAFMDRMLPAIDELLALNRGRLAEAGRHG